MDINKRLREIRYRIDNSTSAPWWGSMISGHVEMFAGDGSANNPMIASGALPGNAEFIVNAKQDVPYLLVIVERVQALLAEYEKDDQEHLNTFGQHHPYAGWAADHLREALTGEA